MILMLDLKFNIGDTVAVKTETEEYVPWQILSFEVMQNYTIVYWAETSGLPVKPFYDFQLLRWDERFNDME
jgi:hypothetical protein